MASETKEAQGTLEYRAEFDSLRAIAIIPVVIFHLHPTLLSGGYLGVDVFFVLSGFLITKLLLRELDTGAFRMRSFYARRIRRLAPVILAVVAATMLVATLRLSDAQRVYVACQSVAALTSVANVYVWQVTGDYWGPTAEGTALLHTWSLSVEEQFYLLFPIMLAAVHRWNRSRVTACLLIVVVASGLTYWVVMAASPSASFYLLPTRAWELACGGLLASSQSGGGGIKGPTQSKRFLLGPRFSGLRCLFGVSMILLSYWLPSDSRSNEWNTTLAVAGTMVFLSIPQGASCLRYFSVAPLVYLGRVSYSWYMWHWPIIVLNELTGMSLNRWWIGLAGLVISIGSYHGIEQPTRRRQGILRPILIAYSLLLGIALVSTLPRRIQPVDRSLYAQPVWYGSYYNAYPAGETNEWYQRIIRNVRVPRRQGVGNEFENEGIRTDVSETPQVVLLGDSHATMWAHLIHQICEQRGHSLSIWAVNGMDPAFAKPQGREDSIKSRYDAARIRKLQQWRPQLSIISNRWSMRDRDRTRQFIEFVASCSENVLLIGPTPELRIGDENVLRHLQLDGVIPQQDRSRWLPRVDSAAIAESTQLIREIARAIPNVHFLEVSQRYEVGSGSLVLVGRQCVYLDDDHLTDFGTWLARPIVEDALDVLLRQANEPK